MGYVVWVMSILGKCNIWISMYYIAGNVVIHIWVYIYIWVSNIQYIV